MTQGAIDLCGVKVGRVWLAPMAGYTDIAFRTLAKEFGAALTVTEMISVRGIVHNSAATEKLLCLAPTECPSCVQLFGSNPEDFYRAAGTIECDIIDINMGCPMPKIVKNGDGSALMTEPECAADIVRATIESANKPVTVKTRLGFETGHDDASALIERVAKAGAAAVTVHGRYAEQRYAGNSDFDAIERLKSVAPIPMIASGDINRGNLSAMLSRFDGVAIGRAALGDIGLFDGSTPDPTAVARRHLELLERYFDEHYTVVAARKFFPHYFRGNGSKPLRNAVNAAKTANDVYKALEEYESARKIGSN